MAVTSNMLAQLIEPTLFFSSRPNEKGVTGLLDRAQTLVREVKDEMQAAGEQVHQPSFELGVGKAFVELLATIRQRTWLNDAMRSLEEIPKGTEALHTLAFLERSSVQATQGELADLLGVDRGNFSRNVRRLEEGGFLRSQRAGKKVLYYLTPMASEILDEARPGWKAIHPQTLELLEKDAAAASAVYKMLPSIDALTVREHVEIFQAAKAAAPAGMLQSAGTDLLGMAKMSRMTLKAEVISHRGKMTRVDELRVA